MPRPGRVRAVLTLSVLVVSGSLLSWSPAALADHCPPIDNPDPVPGQNTTYCHTPPPTPRPATPRPTVRPTTDPATPAPRTAPPRVVGPTRPSPGVTTTAEPTPFDIEVPEEPLATLDIEIDPGIDDPTEFEAGEQAGAASNWIFGFIVGFLFGAIAGRMSWGLRRRRRQQIFG